MWVKDLSKEEKAHLSSEKGETIGIIPFDSSCEANNFFCFSDHLRDSSIKSPIPSAVQQSIHAFSMCLCVCPQGCGPMWLVSIGGRKVGKELQLSTRICIGFFSLISSLMSGTQLSLQLLHHCSWWLTHWACLLALLLKCASVAYCAPHTPAQAQRMLWRKEWLTGRNGLRRLSSITFLYFYQLISWKWSSVKTL